MTAESPGATTETEAPAPDGNEQVDSPGAESPPAAETDAGENEKAKTGFSQRIDELTRLRREAERDRDYYREMALRSQPREEPAPREVPREQPVEPELKTLADFSYDEKAYSKYMLGEAQKLAKREAENLRQEFRSTRETEDREYARTEFQSRVSDWAKGEKIADFDVIFDPATPITESMAEIIMGSEVSAPLAYYLAKNRQLTAQIARLPPSLQAYELGRIEATKLAKPTAPKVSEAPPPPPRVQGSGTAGISVKADDPASDKLSDAEWTALRNKQDAARRARRFAKT